MGKLRNWLQKRKVNIQEESQPEPPFPVSLVETWEQKRKTREDKAKEEKLNRERLDGLNLYTRVSKPHLQHPPISYYKYKPDTAPQPHRASASQRITPFRVSETSRAMVLHAASLNIRQQIDQPSQPLTTFLRTSTDPVSKLNPDVLFYLLDFLDPLSILQLKFSNKRMHHIISLNHLDEDILSDIWEESAKKYPFVRPKTQQPGISDERRRELDVKRKERENQAGEIDIMICGSCCDYLFQVPGISAKDVCRCGQASISTTGRSLDWIVQSKKPSNDRKVKKKRVSEILGTSKEVKKPDKVPEPSQSAPKLPLSNESDILKPKPLISGDVIPEAGCLMCLRANSPAPGQSPIPCSLHPKTGAAKSKPSQVVSTPAIHTRKRTSIFGALRADLLKNRPRKTCPKCSHYSEFTTGVTLLSEMCRCPHGPIPLNFKPSPIESITKPIEPPAPSTIARPARKACRTCHRFSEIVPGITLASQMCQCPGGPLTIKYPAKAEPPKIPDAPPSTKSIVSPVIPSCPSCQFWILPDGSGYAGIAKCRCSPRPVAATSSIVVPAVMGVRECCGLCGKFSSITTTVTLNSLLCGCPDGPLVVKKPWARF